MNKYIIYNTSDFKGKKQRITEITVCTGLKSEIKTGQWRETKILREKTDWKSEWKA